MHPSSVPIPLRRTCAAIALLAALPGLALACDDGQHPLFACITTKDRYVEICDAGKTISYKFGKLGQSPEMAFSVPRHNVSTIQGGGSQGTDNAVSIQYGNTVYTVYSEYDRWGPAYNQGLFAEVRGKLVGSHACKTGSERNHLDGVRLRPTR